MRIFYVTDIKADPKSAQTVHVDEVCDHFSQLGHEVTLFIPVCPIPFGEKNYAITYLRSTEFASTAVFQFKLFFVLLFAFHTQKPDILYVRHSLLFIIPLLVARLRHITIVFEVNGKLIKEANVRKHSKIGQLLHSFGVFRLFEYLNLTYGTKVICVTDGIREYVIENYNLSPAKCFTINNGVNLSLFSPQDSEKMRTQIGLKLNSVYVGYVGSFFGWQGLRYVAEAARLCSITNSEIKFIVVGEGDEKDWLIQYRAKYQLEDTIIIRDAVDRGMVPVYINSFDICLCTPTRFREGSTSPFKVYEYLACGKAVIVSDILGMREEFADTVTYVEPESAEALATRIVELAHNPDWRSKLGAVGRQTVQTNRSWEVAVRKILKTL